MATKILAWTGGLALALLPSLHAHADLVYAWGNCGYGQLGLGTTGIFTSPVPVTSLGGNVSGISEGYNFGHALIGGAVYGWGFNDRGQVGDGTTSINDHHSPVALPALSSGVTAISQGGEHGLAIRNGGVYAWGYNDYGEIGDGTTITRPTPVPVSTLSSGVTAISGGQGDGPSNFSLALKNGGVYAWGYNGYGQLGDGTHTDRHLPTAIPTLSSNVTVIAGGTYHALAIKGGGVYAWGDNSHGQLGDGTIVDQHSPIAVSQLASDATAVACGSFHSLAVMNGQVFAWGDNEYGQLGDGTSASKRVPTLVPGLSSITKVAAGYYSSYALASDGSLWVWGLDNYGQLGLGDQDVTRHSPQHLMPPTGYFFTGISIGGESVLATVSTVPAPSAGASLVGGLMLLTRRRRARLR